MKYKTIYPKEKISFTLNLLNQKWKATNEAARQAKNKLNAADCNIFRRGQVWMIEHDGDILYYESHNENYPFFENAFHFMNVEKRAAWKTVKELITFRTAIREATVQGTDYCNTILEDPLTARIYQKFMRYARAHDRTHHGINTF